MKTIKSISLIKVEDLKITVFKSAIEKQEYTQTHPDAQIRANIGIEPLYMLIDTEGSGFCLTPKRAITYNEAITLIDMYY